MQIYYFYLHPELHTIYVRKDRDETLELAFIWIDCSREDVVGRSELWQKEIHKYGNILINEYHLKDILNLEHPCIFDTLDDYNLLIFRKLITPDDQIKTNDQSLEIHEQIFGLSTTPISFITTPQVLVTVREVGNKAIESYVQRIETISNKVIEDQNKPRKLPNNPLDLSLRLLNVMIDGYLDLRLPLSRRIEHWQKELLQGHQRFTKWHQLLQENMAFQQIENLCEEQIECLQKLRDEIVENYGHLKVKKRSEGQDIILVRMDDLSSHIERIQKYIARLRSAVQAAIDLHFSAVANQTNENMRILAIITAVFAPLTLLTGIYGMNFEHMPELGWKFGYPLVLVGLAIVCGLLFRTFRRNRWL